MDSAGGEGGATSSGGQAAAGGQQPSRYESQKRRDWNTFLTYLRNHKPPLALARCSGAHVIEFLRYLDQFGKTKVHGAGCAFYGHPNPPGPCACPLRQAWGSLDALIGRLRAAYEESGGTPETNPFAARAVRIFLRDVRENQAKARGIPYEKKKRKRLPQAASSSTPAAAAAAAAGGGESSSSAALSGGSSGDGSGAAAPLVNKLEFCLNQVLGLIYIMLRWEIEKKSIMSWSPTYAAESKPGLSSETTRALVFLQSSSSQLLPLKKKSSLWKASLFFDDLLLNSSSSVLLSLLIICLIFLTACLFLVVSTNHSCASVQFQIHQLLSHFTSSYFSTADSNDEAKNYSSV